MTERLTELVLVAIVMVVWPLGVAWGCLSGGRVVGSPTPLADAVKSSAGGTFLLLSGDDLIQLDYSCFASCEFSDPKINPGPSP
jgi:hypothetical protein